MTQYDAIFAKDPMEGFQDIWFFDLEPARVIELYEFACPGGYPDEARAHALQDASCMLDDFVFDGVVLSGIGIRIEAENLVVDFYNGLDYWTEARQLAFLGWLRTLYLKAPEARLAWAAEGADHHPSARETDLVLQAVNGV